MVVNSIEAVAVGGVLGIYGIQESDEDGFVSKFDNLDLKGRIVPHSHGFTKVEINQMNALIQEITCKLEESVK